MEKVQRGWTVYDRVIVDLWEKLSPWLPVRTVFSLGSPVFNRLVGLIRYLLRSEGWPSELFSNIGSNLVVR